MFRDKNLLTLQPENDATWQSQYYVRNKQWTRRRQPTNRGAYDFWKPNVHKQSPESLPCTSLVKPFGNWWHKTKSYGNRPNNFNRQYLDMCSSDAHTLQMYESSTMTAYKTQREENSYTFNKCNTIRVSQRENARRFTNYKHFDYKTHAYKDPYMKRSANAPIHVSSCIEERRNKNQSDFGADNVQNSLELLPFVKSVENKLANVADNNDDDTDDYNDYDNDNDDDNDEEDDDGDDDDDTNTDADYDGDGETAESKASEFIKDDEDSLLERCSNLIDIIETNATTMTTDTDGNILNLKILNDALSFYAGSCNYIAPAPSALPMPPIAWLNAQVELTNLIEPSLPNKNKNNINNTKTGKASNWDNVDPQTINQVSTQTLKKMLKINCD